MDSSACGAVGCWLEGFGVMFLPPTLIIQRVREAIKAIRSECGEEYRAHRGVCCMQGLQQGLKVRWGMATDCSCNICLS